jgi:hypothetical protein
MALLLALVITLMLVFTMFIAPAHGILSKPHTSSLGAPVYQENPNQYLMGYVSDANVAETRAGRSVVVLEMRPTNTYAEFSQSIAFCSITAEQATTLVSGVVVLTYSKVMHREDCYDLYRVDKVGK